MLVFYAIFNTNNFILFYVYHICIVLYLFFSLLLLGSISISYFSKSFSLCFTGAQVLSWLYAY